jgi:parallel beta-helix repeat protein
VNKGGTAMKNGKLIGRIFAIALVLALIGSMLGGLVSTVVGGAGQIIAPGDLSYNSARKLARTSDGLLHCVYSRSDGQYSQIYHSYSSDGGITWTEEQITTGSHNHFDPSIAIGSNDHIYVAWYYCGSGTWGNTCTTQYREKTTAWQPIENVITGYHRFPSIAVDNNDNIHLIVGGANPGGYNCDHAQYLKRTSSGWSSPEEVSSTCWAGSPPAIAVDQNGNVHVVYSHAPQYGPHYGLRYRERTASGWQSEEVIQTDDQDWSSASIALDSNGDVYVVYYLGWCSASTGVTPGPIKLSKRTSSGWQPAEDICLASEYPQINPTIAIDSNNYLHVVWQGKHSGSPDYYQIRYRKYTTGWSPIQNLTSASVNQTNPNLIWAWWPSVNNLKTNTPKNGYAFVWNDGSDIKMYTSSDLEWETGPGPGTWYVDDDLVDYPNADFTTIYEAVHAASSGGTIIVYPGTYIENVDVGWASDIKIKSLNGPDSTFLQPADPAWAGFTLMGTGQEITGFTIREAETGILLSGARNCYVSNNILSDNGIGIVLSYFGLEPYIDRPSENNTIVNNELLNNEVGIDLEYARWNTIASNEIIDNDWWGIYFVHSHYNVVTNNLFSGNPEVGIGLQDSSNNSIYLNSFISNGAHVDVAYDDLSNSWNSPEEINYTYSGTIYSNYLGNYWDDYSGSDADGDGIGETPYPIDSDADNYPLMEPVENYVIGEDTTPPTISSVSPEDDATDVPIDTVISATFNEAMDSSTVNETSFTLEGSTVTGAVTYDPVTYTATFTPDADLDYNHEYTATLSTTITDLAGNPLVEPCTWSFTTKPTKLQKVIQEEAEEIRTITVDGEEYYIVTLKRYIDPETWEASDYSFFAEEPPAWIVYTYPNFQPVHNEELLRRIWTVDRANRLLGRIGSVEGILVDIETIDNVIDASEGLAEAEWMATAAKIGVFTVLDLVVFAEIGAPISDYEILLTIKELVGQYTDPVTIEMTFGHALLEGSRTCYHNAREIAESNSGGISDYNTAKEYLNYYYQGYFELQLGVALALPAEIVLESPFQTIAGWIPDYISHLGHKVVSLVSVWTKVTSTTTQVAGIAKDINTAVDYQTELYNYIDNELEKIPENISIMFEHESFPVDYTLALLNQDKQSLYDRWGIHGVDELNLNLCSPAELRVYDSQGRITGVVGGEVRVEIPDSYYSYPSHSITIFFPDDSYVIEIEGTDEGLYGLEVSSIENGEVSYFMATDIPTAPRVVHQYTIDWDALSEGEEGVTVQIDSDGDGEFEDTFTSDEELTQDEFMHETIPQLLKQDAISNLEVIEPSERTAQHLIDSSSWFINKSLVDKLWVDDSHLCSAAMAGALVFDMEKAAVIRLKRAERIEPTIKDEIEAVIDKLAKADKLLCIIVIDDAKGIEVENPWREKIADMEIARAEEQLDKACGYLEKDMPAWAITYFKLSWMHAQEAIRLLKQEIPCFRGRGSYFYFLGCTEKTPRYFP